MAAFFSTLNLWAVLVSAVAFWLSGALWFTLLFGRAWLAEVEKHGVKIKEAAKNEMALKLIMNFAYNLLAAFASAFFVHTLAPGSTGAAIAYGLAAGLGFTLATFGISFLWESRSLKLLLLDTGHSILGIILSFVILNCWK